MQGSVRQRGNKWYYRYRDIDGKLIERVGGLTKKEAQKKLTEAINRLNTGFSTPNEILLKNYLIQWLDEYVKPSNSDNTYDVYKRIIIKRIIPSIGSVRLCDLKSYHIQTFINTSRKIKKKNGESISETTLQKYYGVINTALNRAVKLQLIYQNPCSFVDTPKRNRFKSNYLSITEYKVIYNSLNEKNYDDYIFKLALNLTIETGLRRGEMCGLCWDDIDFDNKTITVSRCLKRIENNYNIGDTKTHTERILPISDLLINQLKKHLILQKENRLKYGNFYTKNFFNNIEYNLLFTKENGEYITPSRFLQRLKRKCTKNNINKNIRWHDLRHTNATFLIQQGVNMKIIQERLGHANFSTTADIYSHVSTDMSRVATDKLLEILK